MDRLTLLETLKSKSMTLSFEDIQGIMDEELNNYIFIIGQKSG